MAKLNRALAVLAALLGAGCLVPAVGRRLGPLVAPRRGPRDLGAALDSDDDDFSFTFAGQPVDAPRVAVGNVVLARVPARSRRRGVGEPRAALRDLRGRVLGRVAPRRLGLRGGRRAVGRGRDVVLVPRHPPARGDAALRRHRAGNARATLGALAVGAADGALVQPARRVRLRAGCDRPARRSYRPLEASFAARRLSIDWTLWLGVALALLAFLANPWGLRILEYPIAYLDSNSPFREILEWQRPPFELDPRQFSGRFFWLLLAVALGAVLELRERLLDGRAGGDLYLVALATVTTAMALTSRRFIPLFAITSLPLVARLVAEVARAARTPPAGVRCRRPARLRTRLRAPALARRRSRSAPARAAGRSSTSTRSAAVKLPARARARLARAELLQLGRLPDAARARVQALHRRARQHDLRRARLQGLPGADRGERRAARATRAVRARRRAAPAGSARAHVDLARVRLDAPLRGRGGRDRQCRRARRC